MSEYPKDSFNNPNLHSGITPEQIPHSGIHHDEYPVDEFDNTPLPEAMERGLVNPTPDTPAGLEPADPAEKKSHKRLVIGGAAFLAGAAVIAGSVIGIKAVSDAPKNSAPEPDPNATSQTPEATPPSTEQAEVLTVKSLELPATLTPEQLGTTFVQDRRSRWQMAGSVGGDQLKNDWIRTTLADKDFLAPIIAMNGDTFADALFVSNWRENPDLVKWIEATKANNFAGLQLWLKTYNSGDSNDVEPFNYSATVESTTVVSQTANTVSISSAATEHTNADKNRADKLDPGGATVDGNKMTVNTTFQLVDGAWKISALDIVSRQ
jgi:hypothetical protein